ncbi:MAG: 3-deoxy-D-manno-octulosonic acid transferase [Candidatus Gastranaerophilales bacterium]|nr:3-deoxy-D-manno-octulosonic acid transferase [Candidatus Gastranaerophilales bacterium]
MYLIYSLLLLLLGIVLSPVIFVLFILKPKLRAGFWRKIGFYPDLRGNNTIWIHAVSVGEVNAVESYIKKLRQQYPACNLVLTTVTRTGQQVARSKLSKVVNHITYFPYDFIFSVKSSIKAIDPKLVIIAETEIWPNFSHEVNKAGIPLVLVNGRISPNSYKNYKRFRFFLEKFLKNYSLILMQTEKDRNRIIDIGADSLKVEVMGNLKFDNTSILEQTDIDNLKKSYEKNDKKILIAGSTHKTEDELILNVYSRLKMEFNNLKLIIAPRHPERNDQVLKLISERGFKFGLRSKSSNFNESDISLLDTMGELSKLYSICDLAFIGGSFSNTGGHNPLESAIYGVPVISGPTVFNFKDIYSYMTAHNAAVVVNNEQELYEKIKDLLINSEKYQEMSRNCINIFESNKGALDFAVSKIKDYLD